MAAIPTVFIVGAPRCGTTSLAAYLGCHPGLFLCEPKEPHHFGTDLDIRLRPYADRRRYLDLFQDAGAAQQAGEASVLYLYSKTAPEEIREFSPGARIIIMLRDPVDMVCSLHAHNLLVGHEDLPDLEEALSAEEERRRGRGISSLCFLPTALHYSGLGKYAEQVRRYQAVFGSDRVRCILFEDLKKDPERVYRETLAFLGMEPAGSPDFKVHNERQRWWSRRVGRAIMTAYSLAYYQVARLPLPTLRGKALNTLGGLFYLSTRLNLRRAEAPRLSRDLRERLREMFRADVEQLGALLKRDLSSWLQADSGGLSTP